MMKKWISFLSFLCAAFIQNVETAAQEVSCLKPNEIFIESNGSKLFCRCVGKGKPLVVIHGGLGLTQDYLLPQLYSLADNNFVIFYDQRGCGRSIGEINQETINIFHLVNDLECIRRAFNFDKISILGHSWGGFLAMHYAIGHPQFVEKLILSNSLPACSEGRSLFLEEYKNRTAPYQEELSAISSSSEFQVGDPKTIERYYRIIFRTYCYQPEKAELLNLQMTPIASVNGAKIFQLLWKSVFENSYDLHASLKTLRIPTLVIHGDADPIPAITAQKIHESIPESKYVLLKQCGHFPYVEQREEYFNHLRKFLSISDTSTSDTLFVGIARRVAFDIGSGQIKMQVSDVDLVTNKIVNVLLTDTAYVKLRENLSCSLDGRFSLDIQNKTVEAISKLVKKAAPFHPEAYHAIATEALRLARNSGDLAARIKNETGVPVTIVSQEEEGILGFISAVSETDVDPDQVVAWDFGGGSFQLTTRINDHYSVYQGRLGKVPLKTALLKIQGKDPDPTFSPNPISEPQCAQTIQFIKESIQNVPEDILQKLKSPNTIVLGVGIHPLWGMPDNGNFDRDRVVSEIFSRLNLDDDAIRVKDSIAEERKEASAYVVSNLILARGVMEALDIKQVHYVGTQGANAIGALLSPQYWKKSRSQVKIKV